MHFINSEEFEMKALNRAIARTVSQIARYAGEGCHVPMIMALENHLDALLTMDRKMLEGVQDVVGPDGKCLPSERVASELEQALLLALKKAVHQRDYLVQMLSGIDKAQLLEMLGMDDFNKCMDILKECENG